MATQRKCNVRTGSYQFKINCEFSWPWFTKHPWCSLLSTRCFYVDTKLQCFTITLWINLIITMYQKIVRIPIMCLFFLSSFSGSWVINQFCIFPLNKSCKTYLGPMQTPGANVIEIPRQITAEILTLLFGLKWCSILLPF